MSELTSGKGYPVKWPRKVTAAYLVSLAIIAGSSAAIGWYYAGDWVGPLLLATLYAALFGAMVVNGVLIVRAVRKKHPRSELTPGQKRVQVGAVLLAMVVALPSASLVIFRDSLQWEWIWGLQVVCFIALVVFQKRLYRGVSRQELEALEKRRIEMQDETMFSKEKSDIWFVP